MGTIDIEVKTPDGTRYSITGPQKHVVGTMKEPLRIRGVRAHYEGDCFVQNDQRLKICLGEEI